jgi:DNA-binding HxlR family transcriptional regulator
MRKTEKAAVECPFDPEVAALVDELIGRVADKWTLIVLETLEEKGEMRFSRLAEEVRGISQKMLTQTLRAMERDGLVSRKVFAVVPPRVEYKLTELGLSLSYAFCGVWMWAGENLKAVQAARGRFDRQAKQAS